MKLSRYRALLAVPGFPRLLASSLVARLPQAMTGLAMILYVTGGGGSYPAAGLIVAVFGLASGLTTPMLGRVIDRRGPRRVLPPCSLASVGALASFAALPATATGSLALVAGVAGAVNPPITPAARALWTTLVPAADRPTVFALEATAQELVYVTGPALVAAVVALASAAAAVVVTGVLGLAGMIAFTTAPAVRRARASTVTEGPRGRRLPPGLPALAAIALLLVAALGVAEIAVVAASGEAGSAGLSGLLLAGWSAGSIGGGLAWGAAGGPVGRRPEVRDPSGRAARKPGVSGRRWSRGRLARSGVRADLRRPGLGVMVAVLGASVALVAVGPGLAGIAVLLVISGATVAPTLAVVYARVERTAAGSATEAFGWLTTAALAGGTVGAAAGGALADAVGPRVALFVAGTAVLAAVPPALLSDRRGGQSRPGNGGPCAGHGVPASATAYGLPAPAPANAQASPAVPRPGAVPRRRTNRTGTNRTGD